MPGLNLTVPPGPRGPSCRDGFPELRDGDRELGYPRARSLFQQACQGSASSVVRHLEEATRSFTGGQPPDDDVTFVVVKISG